MFHSRFNRILAVGVWLLCATAALTVVIFSLQRNGELIPVTVFLAFLAWAGLWRPSVEVDDSGVRLGNVLSTTTVPWEALIQIDTRYALTLVTPRGSYSAIAAPAPGRLVGTLRSRRDVAGVRGASGGTAADGLRPGDLPTTDSGAAAHLVRQRWEQLLAEGKVEIGVADQTPVSRRWHWLTILVGSILAAIAVVAFALG